MHSKVTATWRKRSGGSICVTAKFLPSAILNFLQHEEFVRNALDKQKKKQTPMAKCNSAFWKLPSEQEERVGAT